MEQLNKGRERANDPAALALKLANRAKLLSSRVTPKAAQVTTSFLTFSSGQDRFGVPLNDVIEIQALHHYSRVPKTPPFVVRVIPWRGAILSLLDLGRLFGIPESGIADHHASIIVEAAGKRVAVVAREVEDILDIPEEQVKRVPVLPDRALADWVLGVHDGNRLLLCLERLLQDDKIVNWKRTTPC